MKENNNKLFISKISTGLQGFDDLFYGGLRLPGTNAKGGGICIVIYGNRGISKSDLAMQIMYGIDSHVEKVLGSKMEAHYYTVNHRESELKKKYLGLKVSELLNAIRYQDNSQNAITKCLLCDWFPELPEQCKALLFEDGCGRHGCDFQMVEKCKICKLVRHEIINYNDRSETLHWTVGNTCDMSNYLARLDDSKIDTESIFGHENEDGNPSNRSYYSTAQQKFRQIQKKLFESTKDYCVNRGEVSGGENGFQYSCIVIEGFTAFDTEELDRLPIDDLIHNLRSAAAVSVLVFDDRGKNLHLNADIIIQMRKQYDVSVKYMYHELHIEKSDLQQHVHGWQKYKKQRDLSVEIFPSIHSVLLKRFATSNSILRLEQGNMRYPQSLLQQFQYKCFRQKEQPNKYASELIARIIEEKEGRSHVFDPKNSKTKVDLIDSDCYESLYTSTILQQLSKGKCTIVICLLGRNEQQLRKRLDLSGFSEEKLANIHCWEMGFGCIWPEEFISIMKRYINRWKKRSSNKHLHLIIDDFANINIYPLLEREPLLVPALVTLCQNATFAHGFENNDRGVDIELSMVCTSKDSKHYNIIKELSNY